MASILEEGKNFVNSSIDLVAPHARRDPFNPMAYVKDVNEWFVPAAQMALDEANGEESYPGWAYALASTPFIGKVAKPLAKASRKAGDATKPLMDAIGRLGLTERVEQVFSPMTKSQLNKFNKENPGFIGAVANAKPRAMTKEEQLDVILKKNPMRDDYHYGTRTIDDVHTLQEVVDKAKEEHASNNWGEKLSGYPDVENDVFEKALESGYIDVYSSKPIVNGNFVATSPMMAQEYGSMNRPPNYHQRVPISDISWLDVEQGQVARREPTDKYVKAKKKEANNALKNVKEQCKGMFINSPQCKESLTNWTDLERAYQNMYDEWKRKNVR